MWDSIRRKYLHFRVSLMVASVILKHQILLSSKFVVEERNFVIREYARGKESGWCLQSMSNGWDVVLLHQIKREFTTILLAFLYYLFEVYFIYTCHGHGEHQVCLMSFTQFICLDIKKWFYKSVLLTTA